MNPWAQYAEEPQGTPKGASPWAQYAVEPPTAKEASPWDQYAAQREHRARAPERAAAVAEMKEDQEQVFGEGRMSEYRKLLREELGKELGYAARGAWEGTKALGRGVMQAADMPRQVLQEALPKLFVPSGAPQPSIPAGEGKIYPDAPDVQRRVVQDDVSGLDPLRETAGGLYLAFADMVGYPQDKALQEAKGLFGGDPARNKTLGALLHLAGYIGEAGFMASGGGAARKAIQASLKANYGAKVPFAVAVERAIGQSEPVWKAVAASTGEMAGVLGAVEARRAVTVGEDPIEAAGRGAGMGALFGPMARRKPQRYTADPQDLSRTAKINLLREQGKPPSKIPKLGEFQHPVMMAPASREAFYRLFPETQGMRGAQFQEYMRGRMQEAFERRWGRKDFPIEEARRVGGKIEPRAEPTKRAYYEPQIVGEGDRLVATYKIPGHGEYRVTIPKAEAGKSRLFPEAKMDLPGAAPQEGLITPTVIGGGVKPRVGVRAGLDVGKAPKTRLPESPVLVGEKALERRVVRPEIPAVPPLKPGRTFTETRYDELGRPYTVRMPAEARSKLFPEEPLKIKLRAGYDAVEGVKDLAKAIKQDLPKAAASLERLTAQLGRVMKGETILEPIRRGWTDKPLYASGVGRARAKLGYEESKLPRDYAEYRKTLTDRLEGFSAFVSDYSRVFKKTSSRGDDFLTSIMDGKVPYGTKKEWAALTEKGKAYGLSATDVETVALMRAKVTEMSGELFRLGAFGDMTLDTFNKLYGGGALYRHRLVEKKMGVSKGNAWMDAIDSMYPAGKTVVPTGTTGKVGKPAKVFERKPEAAQEVVVTKTGAPELASSLKDANRIMRARLLEYADNHPMVSVPKPKMDAWLKDGKAQYVPGKEMRVRLDDGKEYFLVDMPRGYEKFVKKWVEKSVYDDLTSMPKIQRGLETWFKGMAVWRASKAGLNAQNILGGQFMQNTVLWDTYMPKAGPYSKEGLELLRLAAKDVLSKSREFRKAQAHNTFGGSMAGADVQRLLKQIVDGKLTYPEQMVDAATEGLRVLMKPYLFGDNLYKMLSVRYLQKYHGMTDYGLMSRIARKWFLDYTDLPQFAKVARSVPLIGAPFISWPTLIGPRLMEVMVAGKHAARFWKYPAALVAAGATQVKRLGVTQEELQKAYEGVPEWAGRWLVPIARTKDGDLVFYNPKYILAITDYIGVKELRQFFSGGPERALWDAATDATGHTKKIIKDRDVTTGQQAKRLGKHVYRTIAPTVALEAERVGEWAVGKERPTGEKRTFIETVPRGMPFHIAKGTNRAYRIERIKNEYEKAERDIKGGVKRKDLTPEQAAKQLRAAKDRMDKELKDMREPSGAARLFVPMAKKEE